MLIPSNNYVAAWPGKSRKTQKQLNMHVIKLRDAHTHSRFGVQLCLEHRAYEYRTCCVCSLATFYPAKSPSFCYPPVLSAAHACAFVTPLLIMAHSESERYGSPSKEVTSETLCSNNRDTAVSKRDHDEKSFCTFCVEASLFRRKLENPLIADTRTTNSVGLVSWETRVFFDIPISNAEIRKITGIA